MNLLIINCDLYTKLKFNELVNFHFLMKAEATMCVKEKVVRQKFGIIKTKKEKIIDIKEKPIIKYFINAGIYIISSKLIKLIPNKKFYLMTQLFENIIGKKIKHQVFPILEKWNDIGTLKDLRKFKIERNKDLAYLDDGPPCLATLMGQGIPEGGRDNTLYQYAVYAKKKWPDDWQNKIDEFNHKYMERPLGSQQVQKTIRQHEKKDYQYKCKDQPMCGVCSSIQCRTRPYGIGDDIDYKVSDLTKFQSDKSIWFLNIDGERMRVSTEELYNQHKFRLACMDQVHALPNLMPQQMWTRKIQALMKEVEVIKLPYEISKTGKFESLLEKFLEDQGEAENIDEIRIGKALFEEKEYIEKTDNGKADKVKKMTAFFKMDSLEKFLEKNRFKDFTTQEMTAHIRDKLGGGDTRRKVLNKTTYMWYVPWQKKVDTELARPNMDEETPF